MEVAAFSRSLDEATRVVSQMSTASTAAIGRLDQSVTTLVQHLGALAPVTRGVGFDTLAIEAQRAAAQAQAAATATRGMTTAAQGLRPAFQGLQGLLSTALSAAGGIGLATTLSGIVTLLKDVATAAVQAAVKAETLAATFKAITGSTQAAGETLRFLWQQAERLGIAFPVAVEGFKGLQAAARGTALDGQATRDIFVSFAQAARVLGLSGERVQQIFTALQQILSKGTLSSEELRQQLGESLPGAFAIAARSIGVTTDQLDAMLRKGLILSADFLPAFGRQMRKEFGGGAEDAAKLASASFAKFSNEALVWATAIGEVILPVIKAFAEEIANVSRLTRELFGIVPPGTGGSSLTGPLGQRVPGRTGAPLTPTALTGFLEQAAASQKIDPEIMKRLILTESGFDPLARSPKGAIGLGQVLPSTAAQFGVGPQDLFDPATNLRVTAQYLAALLEQFKTHTDQMRLAIAAYNAGPTRVQEAIDKARAAGLPATFEGIRSFLPKETQAFVPKVFGAGPGQPLQVGDALPRPPLKVSTELTPEGVAIFSKGIDKALLTIKDAQEQTARLQKQGIDFGTSLGDPLKQEIDISGKALEKIQETLADVPGLAAKLTAEQRLQITNAIAHREQLLQQLEVERTLPAEARKRVDALKEIVAETDKATARRQALIESVIQGDPVKGLPTNVDEIRGEIEAFEQQLTTSTGPALEAINSILFTLYEAKQRAFGEIPDVFAQGTDRMTGSIQAMNDTLKETPDEVKRVSDALQKLAKLEGVDPFEERRTAINVTFDQLERDLEGNEERILAARRIRARELGQIDEAETKKVKDELKEQSREYEQFAKRTQATVANTIFDVLSGRIRSFKDLLGTLKDAFLRILSEMVAAAITRPIVIPVITAALGALGGALGGTLSAIGGTGAVASGASGGDTLSSILGFGQQANAVSGALGGPTTQGLVQQSGTIANFLQTPLLSFGGSVAPAVFSQSSGALIGGSLASSGAVGGATLGSGGVLGGAIGGTAGDFAAFGGASQGLTGGAGGLLSSGAGTGAAAAGLSVGTAVAGVGAGVAAGFALSEFNEFLGLKRALGTRGSNALAGAGGGALAGAIIGSAIPVIGTAIGAAIGTLLGGALGGLLGGGKSQKTPEFTSVRAQAPQFAFQPDEGITVSALGLTSRSRNLGAGAPEVREALQGASDQMLEALVGNLQQFPTAIQERAVPQLQALAQEFANTFENVRFKGKDVQKQVETFIDKALPANFKAIFTPFAKLLDRLAPILQGFDDTITALETRQKELLAAIKTARQSLTESLFSPAQTFETRRKELLDIAGRFPSAPAAEQAQLVPRIASLTQEVFQLAKQEDVFGDDLDALKGLQAQLISILDTTEATTTQIFDEAISVAKEQRDLLLQSVSAQESMTQLMAQAVQELQRLSAFLQPVGSFQTRAGEVRRIPTTGLAVVHQGELVTRPSAGLAPRPPRAPVPVVGPTPEVLRQAATPRVQALLAPALVPLVTTPRRVPAPSSVPRSPVQEPLPALALLAAPRASGAPEMREQASTPRVRGLLAPSLVALVTAPQMAQSPAPSVPGAVPRAVPRALRAAPPPLPREAVPVVQAFLAGQPLVRSVETARRSVRRIPRTGLTVVQAGDVLSVGQPAPVVAASRVARASDAARQPVPLRPSLVYAGGARRQAVPRIVGETAVRTPAPARPVRALAPVVSPVTRASHAAMSRLSPDDARHVRNFLTGTPLVGSFQTRPQELLRVPRTGVALVHAGELIGRPASVVRAGAQDVARATRGPVPPPPRPRPSRVGEVIANAPRPLQESTRSAAVSARPVSPRRQAAIARAEQTRRGLPRVPREAVPFLQAVLAGAPLVGSFATQQGTLRRVPVTGLAVVHAGEFVSRPPVVPGAPMLRPSQARPAPRVAPLTRGQGGLEGTPRAAQALLPTVRILPGAPPVRVVLREEPQTVPRTRDQVRGQADRSGVARETRLGGAPFRLPPETQAPLPRAPQRAGLAPRPLAADDARHVRAFLAGTPLVGSFETKVAEVRRIPRTGVAIVHKGEFIGRLPAREAARLPATAHAVLSTTPPRTMLHLGQRETAMAQTAKQLTVLATLLQPIGSFQTMVGETRIIPQTGMALVHQGERVSRSAGDTSYVEGDIHVTVHATTGASPTGIAQEVRNALTDARRQQRGRNQLARYRQDRGV